MRGRGARLPVHAGLHLGHAHARGRLGDARGKPQRLARQHLAAELRAVDARQEPDGSFGAARHQDAERRRLSERLHDDDARQHRPSREMAGEQRQGGVDIQLGRHAFSRLAGNDARDPQKRVAVRQHPLDDVLATGVAYVHDVSSQRCARGAQIVRVGVSRSARPATASAAIAVRRTAIAQDRRCGRRIPKSSKAPPFADSPSWPPPARSRDSPGRARRSRRWAARSRS